MPQYYLCAQLLSQGAHYNMAKNLEKKQSKGPQLS